MIDEPHLILHKVCGQPAFDVAIYLEAADMWIVSTSGHRAYPYAQWPISEVLMNHTSVADAVLNSPVFNHLPDHFGGEEPRQRPPQRQPTQHSADSLGDLL